MGQAPYFFERRASLKHTLTPIKAIRAKCMDCTCHQPKEIRECPITNCPLWPYRMGHRPKLETVSSVGQGQDSVTV